MIANGETNWRSRSPVFVVGCPRSGTTLLYHMLLSAGNFAVYRTESQVLHLLEPRFGDLSQTRNKKRLMQAWLHSRLFAATGLEAEPLAARIMAECRNGGDFLRIVMEETARRQGVDRWADCTPEHLLYLERIKATIPNALIIHIIRDGRDVALSLEKQRWIKPFAWHRAGSLQAAAIYWEWIVSRGREAGSQLGPDYVELHYEDLVTNPQEALNRVGSFIGQELDYEQIQKVGIGSLSMPNTSFQSNACDGDFSPVERWKKYCPSNKLAGIEALVGTTLEDCGYPPSQSSQTGLKLHATRAFYDLYFSTKFYLRTKTRLGSWLITRNLSWV